MTLGLEARLEGQEQGREANEGGAFCWKENVHSSTSYPKVEGRTRRSKAPAGRKTKREQKGLTYSLSASPFR